MKTENNHKENDWISIILSITGGIVSAIIVFYVLEIF